MQVLFLISPLLRVAGGCLRNGARLHARLVASVTLLLSACGEQAPVDPVSPHGSESTETPRLLSAYIGRCGAARIYDTGHIVYLTVPRTCADANPTYLIPLYAVLGWGTSNSITPHAVVLPRFGETFSIEFEPGVSRTVSIHRRGTWRSFPNQGTWPWRDGADCC